MQPDPLNETTVRGQRSPPAIIARMPPRHPRGAPAGIRHPHPPSARMRKPSPVMKRSPSPGIVGIPIPPGIRPQPAALIRVRTPARIDDRDGRLPNPTIILGLHPRAVRRQGIIKIADSGRFRRGIGRILRDRRFPGRGRGGNVPGGGGWLGQRVDSRQVNIRSRRGQGDSRRQRLHRARRRFAGGAFRRRILLNQSRHHGGGDAQIIQVNNRI